MQPVVRAVGLVKRWGATTALAGATLEVGPGVTGLLGANGAGKTTLLGLVLGLHHQDEGSIEVLGMDPGALGPVVRARLGYAPEHDALPPDVRAHDLVRHLAEIHGIPHRDAVSRTSDILWHVGLGEERFRPLGTMSTGQRQRVKLAAAIVHDPALVLLDEPTNGLDPVQREQMLGLIRRIGTEFGIDVIVSSHLLQEVERVCDAAVILSAGSVVASGPLADLLGRGGPLVLEADTEEGADRVAAVLGERGVTAVVDGLRVTVDVAEVSDDDDLYDAVRDAAVAAGIGIRRLQRETGTLRDVFLETAGT